MHRCVLALSNQLKLAIFTDYAISLHVTGNAWLSSCKLSMQKTEGEKDGYVHVLWGSIYTNGSVQCGSCVVIIQR